MAGNRFDPFIGGYDKNLVRAARLNLVLRYLGDLHVFEVFRTVSKRVHAFL